MVRRWLVVGLAALVVLGVGGFLLRAEGEASVCEVPKLCGVAGELPYEVKAAAGWPARHARGTVIVLHGGGWRHEVGDPRLLAAMSPDARRFRLRGFHTVNASYRPGAAGLSDVRRIYARWAGERGLAPGSSARRRVATSRSCWPRRSDPRSSSRWEGPPTFRPCPRP